MEGATLAGKHVFLCYARVDAVEVDRLQAVLKAAGIMVWRDTDELWPGQDWRARIREAITENAVAFVACFSRAALARDKSFQYQELFLAADEFTTRRPDVPWLIPVRLDDCQIPAWPIGGGRTLRSLQYADLFGDQQERQTARLVQVITGMLTPPSLCRPPAQQPADPALKTTAQDAAQPTALLGQHAGVPPRPPDAPPLTFKGYLASVTLHPDRVQIDRTRTGRINGNESTAIPWRQLTGIDFLDPSLMINGHVHFVTVADPRGLTATGHGNRMAAAARNPHAIMFTWQQRASYKQLRDTLQSRKAADTTTLAEPG